MNYKQTLFWNKVKDSINVTGVLVQMGLIVGDSVHTWNYVVGAGQVIGMLIAIWMADVDKDGHVDVFQKEVKTTVTSDTPITVKTETGAIGKEGSETK